MATETLNRRAQQASRQRRVNPRRVALVVGLFTLFGLYNTWKLFDWQILQYGKLSAQAEAGIMRKTTLVPHRGLIYDSRGQLLAGNTTAEDVYVDKTNQQDDKDLHAICDLLAPALGQDPTDLFTRIKNAPGTNIRVASTLDDAAAAKVSKLVDDNPLVLQYVVSLDAQPLRQYPANDLAASVLGFTDHENVGHYGVEEFYNAKLAGEAGYITAERDSYGRPLVLQQPDMVPARDGSDLVLTIDSAVQYLAERELKNSINEFQADSGYVVVQDPNTGGILAMANYPNFDPNLFSKVT
ncbi:MAG: hypothetical protein M3014_09370, partial [Chloroflexota bacterium]|nr:hypothetical protein [Chloroflexota bacterium]